MIASICGPASDLIELSDVQKQAVAALAKKFTTPALVQAVSITQSLSRSLRGSAAPRALLEAGVVRLAEADKFVDPLSLVERLEALSGGGGGDLKKNVPFRRPAGTGTFVSDASLLPGLPGDTAAAPPAIQWEFQWLAANWAKVMEALSAARAPAVAGLLRLAKVAGFDSGTLKLGFEPAIEGLRRRCQEQSAAINSVFSTLAGAEVRCEFVSLSRGETEKEPPRPSAANHVLSSSEKSEIQKDPAVRAAVGLFDGEVADIRRVAEAPDGEGAGED